MGVDTKQLRVVAKLTCDDLMASAADELDALRKRIQQLERLVCSDMDVGRSGTNSWSAWQRRNDGGWNRIGVYDTPHAAIDAAIKHMEQEASDGE